MIRAETLPHMETIHVRFEGDGDDVIQETAAVLARISVEIARANAARGVKCTPEQVFAEVLGAARYRIQHDATGTHRTFS